MGFRSAAWWGPSRMRKEIQLSWSGLLATILLSPWYHPLIWLCFLNIFRKFSEGRLVLYAHNTMLYLNNSIEKWEHSDLIYRSCSLCFGALLWQKHHYEVLILAQTPRCTKIDCWWSITFGFLTWLFMYLSSWNVRYIQTNKQQRDVCLKQCFSITFHAPTLHHDYK